MAGRRLRPIAPVGLVLGVLLHGIKGLLTNCLKKVLFRTQKGCNVANRFGSESKPSKMEQNSTTATVKTVGLTGAKGKGLSARWSAVQQWCFSRGINQVYAFFKGCDPSIAAHETRIRFVLRNAHAQELTEGDALWLVSMEATIAALKNRKAAA